MRKISVPFICSILWFMAAWAIDRYVLAEWCEPCSRLFSLELEFKFREAANIGTERVSLLILVVLPWLVYAFVVLPYRSLGSAQAWRFALQRWCQPMALLIGAFLLAWLIEYFLYDPLKEHLPSVFTSYAERYTVIVSPLFPAIKTFIFTCHLGGLIGLLVGLYLFLKRSWTVESN